MSERAELGIDGNCGFALLGRDLQEGEAEFVEIPAVQPDNSTHHERYTQERTMERRQGARLWAAKQALFRLRARLGKPTLSYYFGPSHPYGS